MTAYLACYHKQRAPASISTARLVLLQTHSHSCRRAAFPSRNVCHPITVPFKQCSVLPFYFASSLIQGVILPGDTQRIDVIFKSKKPGIKTEQWQLNTHPVLMQGASMQVTLRGLAVFEDQTAHQRLFIEVSHHSSGSGCQSFPFTQNSHSFWVFVACAQTDKSGKASCQKTLSFDCV